LTYTIGNNSDHDVWVCTEVSSIPFELYLTHDRETLLIRKRLDVPTKGVWRRPPAPGTYLRIEPGAAKSEAIQIDLPAKTRSVYADIATKGVAQIVRRLAVEVGYYDTDLPALVRGIFAIADTFGLEGWTLYPDIRRIYFRGLGVRGALSAFYDMNKDPDNEGRVRIEYSHQALTGEKVLRMEINGIAIPYRGLIEADIDSGE
jgi:hypothetical protein